MNLKRKVDAGADFLITQLFFDNYALPNFVKELTIWVFNAALFLVLFLSPPITIKRFTQMSGALFSGSTCG
jgi:methylenetetrahydrofolate reductase (NADPH)